MSAPRAALAAGLVWLGGCAPMASTPGTAPGEPDRVAEINTQLGIEYMRQGSNEVAMRKLEKALQADARYPEAHEAMGLLQARIGEFDKAEDHFKRAMSLAPGDSSIMNNYGQFLCQRERREEAYALFDKAVANPLYATPELAYANAGTCARAGGSLEQAENYYRQALQRNPELAPVLLGMADINFETQRYLTARAYLQRYEAVAQPTPGTLWLGARIERMLGDREAEARYAASLRKRFPDSLEAGELSRMEKP